MSKTIFLRTLTILLPSAFISVWFVSINSNLVYSEFSGPTDVEPVVPAAVLPGLDYAYYEIDASLESQTPVKTGHIANFDITLNERDSNYAFEFSGYLQIAVRNTYTFTVDSNDTVRMSLGGETIIAHSGNAGQPSTSTVDLGVGFYALRIDYSHTDNPSAELEMSWQSPAFSPQILPDQVLFRDDPTAVATVTPTNMPTTTSTPTPTATVPLSDGGTTTFLPTSTPTVPPSSIPSGLQHQLYLPSLLEPVSTNPFIYLANMSDGAIVTSPFDIEMGAANFDIGPAGPIREGAGHFHLMVDVPCVTPGQQIPNDDNHRHYGSGATTVTIELPPGSHTLCLQAGDGGHTALDLTDQVTIIVVSPNLEERVAFSEPASGTVVNGGINVQMVADNFIIEPAGAETPGHGHFHIMIDTPCIAPGNPIPRDDTHLHFGQGQSEAMLTLEPGTHTLCLQAGTGFHNALDLTQVVTITVQPEPQVYFVQPADGATLTETVQIEMGAVNFTIESAGEARDGAGHFHVILNRPCVEVGLSIPADDNHKHFGGGQSTTTLDLQPGYHTLCLQAGNGIHSALPLSHTIGITVASLRQ